MSDFKSKALNLAQHIAALRVSEFRCHGHADRGLLDLIDAKQKELAELLDTHDQVVSTIARDRLADEYRRGFNDGWERRDSFKEQA